MRTSCGLRQATGPPCKKLFSMDTSFVERCSFIEQVGTGAPCREGTTMDAFHKEGLTTGAPSRKTIRD